MRASTWYRVAAVLLLVFAAGHTFGFSQLFLVTIALSLAVSVTLTVAAWLPAARVPGPSGVGDG